MRKFESPERTTRPLLPKETVAVPLAPAPSSATWRACHAALVAGPLVWGCSSDRTLFSNSSIRCWSRLMISVVFVSCAVDSKAINCAPTTIPDINAFFDFIAFLSGFIQSSRRLNRYQLGEPNWVIASSFSLRCRLKSIMEAEHYRKR